MQIAIIALVWAVGFWLSFVMQRTEIAAEKQPYTFGDRLLIIALSLLSFIWVIVVLVSAWVKSISKTGYWSEEINPTVEEKLITKKQVLN